MNESEEIEVEITVHKKVTVPVDIHQVIDSINNLAITRRWNFVAQVLNSIDAENDKDLTEEHRTAIRKYLVDKLRKFE
ncbi:MAG: hypothetical protein MUF12_09015 [Sediminibacterium sp.]|jgi:hypothetical protein|nr:hypothetical protein [Sediminibacterium sp.]